MPYVHRTPIMSCSTIAKMTKTVSFYLKCENFQKIGAFKPRGAFNKMLQLPKNVTSVCTHSSGNNAQAVAYAAKQLGLTSYIIMP